MNELLCAFLIARLQSVLENLQSARKHDGSLNIQWEKESSCLCNAPTVWLLDETAENMAAAKFRLQCTDYNGCEGHLMGIVPLFFYLNYFIWGLKTSTRREVSFLLKSNVKFFDLIPWAVVQNNDTMLKVSRLLATGLEILVANAKFSVALATSWSLISDPALSYQISSP